MAKIYLSRRNFLRASGMTLGAFALAACGAQPSAQFTPAPQTGLTPNGSLQQSRQGFQAILANSVLIVGANRIAFGLIKDGKAIKDAQVHIRFFDLNGDKEILTDEADAPFYGDNLGEAGVYVAHTTFDKPGKWGAQVSAQIPGQSAQTALVGLIVTDKDAIPNVGDPAPRSKNPTLADMNGDRSKICSAVDDDSALHTLSIADALANGKPTVILFATPAFCTSRTCGPSLDVVKAIARNYSDKANFIHIEIYKDFQTFARADTVTAWHLESEPWLFFVGKDGKIAARFEGGITSKEIVPAFQKFIGEG